MSSETKAQRKSMQLSSFLQSILVTKPSHHECLLLIKLLKSQGAMAAMTWPSQDMQPISLNALKSASAECFAEGFHKLDKLRIQALRHLKEVSAPIGRNDRRNKIGLLNKIEQLESARQLIEGNLLVVTHALQLSLNLCEKYVRLINHTEHAETFKAERLEILQMLSYSQNRK
ncbi:hypothetical protein [Pseudomonas viridiflava]|uniref:hypothetical protein n=1 Tax=Pseudomonas viridiflava TaxID=33069 RepID=UPI001303C61B|nr:hypothetical protein [Pseudomonas viridiflava]QXG40914.1 hypothetical protein KTT55_26995 [Pseudomonas viridiflava]